MSRASQISLSIFVIVAIYAITRYNIAKEISFEQFPLYIVNKITAYAALIHFGLLVFSNNLLSDFFGADGKKLKKDFVSIGIFSIILHASISVIILKHYYFPNLIDIEGEFSQYANLSLLFAILNMAIIFLFLSKKFKNAYFIQNLFFWFFLSMHLFFLGINSWINIHEWPWYMPPISLLAFVDAITIVVIIIFQISFKKSER